MFKISNNSKASILPKTDFKLSSFISTTNPKTNNKISSMSNTTN